VTILCEFTTIHKNFREIILQKLPMKNQENLDDYLFFSITDEQEISYVCLIKSQFVEPSSIQSESFNYFKTNDSTPHSGSGENIDENLYLNFLNSLKKKIYELFTNEEIMNSYSFSLVEFLPFIETEVGLINKKNKAEEPQDAQKISLIFDKNKQHSTVESKLRKNTMYSIISKHESKQIFNKQKKKVNCFLYTLIAILFSILIFCVVYLVILSN
jgi:hypothetical protein